MMYNCVLLNSCMSRGCCLLLEFIQFHCMPSTALFICTADSWHMLKNLVPETGTSFLHQKFDVNAWKFFVQEPLLTMNMIDGASRKQSANQASQFWSCACKFCAQNRAAFYLVQETYRYTRKKTCSKELNTRSRNLCRFLIQDTWVCVTSITVTSELQCVWHSLYRLQNVWETIIWHVWYAFIDRMDQMWHSSWQWICNQAMITDPTTTQMYCYTTVCNINDSFRILNFTQ